jgi:hypothetical protein
MRFSRSVPTEYPMRTGQDVANGRLRRFTNRISAGENGRGPSGRARPHSKTCRRFARLAEFAKRRGAVRLPSAAFVLPQTSATFRHSRLALLAIFITLAVILSGELLAVEHESAPYGLPTRPIAVAYLRMPESADGTPPRLLSQTGAFSDTANLVPAPSLIPYSINVSFWSDGAAKSRWIAVPNDSAPEKIRFSREGEWTFPKGTVFVKHFELPVNDNDPNVRKHTEGKTVEQVIVVPGRLVNVVAR